MDLLISDESSCTFHLSSGVITSEQTERNFFLNVYGYSIFWQFDLARTSSARAIGFSEPYISTTMRVNILKLKPEDAHFSKLRFIKVSKQSTKPSEHEIYLNREIF